MESEAMNPPLNPHECATLLRIARDALEEYVRHGRRIDTAAYSLSPRLREAHGAFVTLRHEGDLRGCIGYTRSIKPLADTVAENAVNAASRDPRFPPVTADELPRLHIEISALGAGDETGSPFIRVHDLSEVQIGRDGLYLETANHSSGLLLPQVALEQGWNLEQFLEGVCRKAGAEPHAWRHPGAKLYRFTAQVIEE